jgi:hypothetical protein
MIYYFFLKRALTGEKMARPICTTVFMGDISDFVTIDGVGYIITDFTAEPLDNIYM